jgi:carbon storage regulator CsrA
VTSVRGDQVRLAINAPREIPVLRKEVVEQVSQVNAAAVDSADDVLRLVNLAS